MDGLRIARGATTDHPPSFPRERRGWSVSPRTALLGLLLPLLVCGCRTYQAIPLDPAAEWESLVASGRSLSNLLRPDPPGTIGPSEWFPLATEIDTTDGLELAEANSIALFNNPELVHARHRARVADAQLLQAGLLDNPQLFVGPRFSTDSSDVIVPASIGWELPLWGKRGAREDVATSTSSRTLAELEEKELDVLVAVRLTYIELWGVSQQLEAIEAVEQTTERIATWVEGLLSAGEIDTATFWLASWERNQIAREKQSRRVELRALRLRLHRLLGLLPDAEVRTALDGCEVLPQLQPTELSERRRHPRARAAAATYEEAESRLRLAILEQYPSVQLGPEFEDDDGDTSLGFGLGIELPIFDRNPGGVLAAEVERAAARDEYRATLLSLAHEEAEARLVAESADDRLQLLRSAAGSGAEEALRALDSRTNLGLSSVLEILAAQRALAEARLDQIELQVERTRATLSVSVASGGALREPRRDREEKGE